MAVVTCNGTQEFILETYHINVENVIVNLKKGPGPYRYSDAKKKKTMLMKDEMPTTFSREKKNISTLLLFR